MQVERAIELLDDSPLEQQTTNEDSEDEHEIDTDFQVL